MRAFAAMLPYSPLWKEMPNPAQYAALAALAETRTLFYGGAAGGGKSSVILMAASLDCDNPHHRALIVRRNYTELVMSGGLIQRSLEWWQGNPAMHWNGSEYRWTHKSGATIEFRHMANDASKWALLGGNWNFIAIDEAGQIKGEDIGAILTRLRQGDPAAPPRHALLCSNPLGIGAQYLKETFVDPPPTTRRRFVPARVFDNPAVNPAEYAASLREQLGVDNPVLLRQLLDGDWEAAPPTLIDITKFNDGVLEGEYDKVVRAWDTALSDKDRADYSAGVLMARAGDAFYIVDVERFRNLPGDRDDRMRRVADRDGRGVPIIVETPRGNTGKESLNHWRRVFDGHSVIAVNPLGTKAERATSFAEAVGAGKVYLPAHAGWRKAFVDECRVFPQGEHDDMVDSAAYAYNHIAVSRMRAASINELARRREARLRDGDGVAA